MNDVLGDIKNRMKVESGKIPFDSYTMYYVAQSLYQMGGKIWQDGYPLIRKAIVDSQVRKGSGAADIGSWSGKRVSGKAGQMYATSVGVFALNIPNRFLPILQEGKGSGKRKTIRRAIRLLPSGDKTKLAMKDSKTSGDSTDAAGKTDSPVRLALKTSPAAIGDAHSKERKALTE